MTETALPDVVVPEGSDAVDDLTVRELDMIARQVKCDVLQAMTGRGVEGIQRQAVLARIAWVWAKKADPQAKLDPFLEMTSSQIGHALGFDRDDEDADRDNGAAVPPTTPASGSE